MKRADLGPNLTAKRPRKREFFDEMHRWVPGVAPVVPVRPLAPEGKRRRPPFAAEPMLRLHSIRQWFGPSEPAMEKALHDVAP